MAKFSERDKNILDALQKRVDFCESQYLEFDGLKKYTKANEWHLRLQESRHILDFVSNEMRKPIPEYFV